MYSFNLNIIHQVIQSKIYENPSLVWAVEDHTNDHPKTLSFYTIIQKVWFSINRCCLQKTHKQRILKRKARKIFCVDSPKGYQIFVHDLIKILNFCFPQWKTYTSFDLQTSYKYNNNKQGFRDITNIGLHTKFDQNHSTCLG